LLPAFFTRNFGRVSCACNRLPERSTDAVTRSVSASFFILKKYNAKGLDLLMNTYKDRGATLKN
jgi:hypothetical protein